MRTRGITFSACFLVGLLTASGLAAAADEALLPTLVGRDEADAVSWLEEHGLRARVITLAEEGADPGKVLHQEPPAGDAYAAGEEVVLHVAVRVNIPTLAPSVIGLRERDAVAALADAYFLEVVYQTGPAAREGRVIEQAPAAGTQVPYRSRFILHVVRNAAVVPQLLQLTEAQARARLQGAGLRADVTYAADGAAAPGTVISQDPRSGAEIIPGAAVALRVAGTEPSGPAPGGRVAVPNLVGLTQTAAEHALLTLGLGGHMHWVNSPAHPPYTVVSQETAPGTLVDEGANIGFDVARPRVLPANVTLPSLFGMSEAHALSVLTGYGLGVRVLRTAAPFPVGTVYEQEPAAGTVLSRGASVELKVSLAPPPSWTPPPRSVPDVRGMDAAHARVALLIAGYVPLKRHGLAPDAELDKVFDQEPAPGSAAPFGAPVVYRLPYTSRVPELLGKTREQAEALLTAASLVADAHRSGPAGAGPTQVIWQQHAEGTELARGASVRFRFKVLLPTSSPVPNLIGLTKPQAEARLGAAGFSGLFALEGGAGPMTRVTWQSPAPGTAHAAGALVRARYVRSLAPTMAAVPDVVGRSSDAARDAIEAAGFVADLVLLGGVGPNTRVQNQFPVAGSLRPAGSTVVARYTRVLAVALRPVPQVMGETREQALAILQAEGFTVNFVDAGGSPLGTTTRVVAQNPVAGTLRPSGSSIGVSIQRVLELTPLGVVAVPDVVGLPLGVARSRLEARGLEVTVVGIGSRVASQSVAAGQRVLRGTRVRIRLGF